MKLNQKSERLVDCIISLVIVMAIAPNWIYQTEGGSEGIGLLVKLVGIIFWIYSLIRYAEAKGRSGLLALFLSVLGPLGLVVTIALKDKTIKQ